MPEGFLAVVRGLPDPPAGPEGLVFGFLGYHWGYGRKSLAEWRALLWGVRYGAALRCWSLAGKAVLRQTKYGGVGLRG